MKYEIDLTQEQQDDLIVEILSSFIGDCVLDDKDTKAIKRVISFFSYP